MSRLYLLLVFAMIVMASCAEESCVNVNSEEKICVYVNSAEEICVNVNGEEEFCVNKCKALLAGGVVGAGVLAVGTAPGLVGFGSKGVVAGSMAAATQASIGNVVAGSWFAQTTSFAMSGAAAKASWAGAGILASTTAAAVADCLYTQENEGSFPADNAVNPSSWLNAASSPFATGFGSGGVFAGSMAAATQASIGNVVAGSWFA